MKNIKKQKIEYYILLILITLSPILDVINSLLIRNVDISIGVFWKGVIIAYLFYKVLRNSKLKMTIYTTFLYLFTVGIWFLLTIYNRFYYLSFSNLITEFTGVFKFFYFPVSMLLLFIYTKQSKIDNKDIQKIMTINFIIYTILLFIPYITGTNFYSYDYKELGSIGWFYAANEIGPIMVLSLYFAMNSILETNAFDLKKILKYIIIPIGIYLIIIIGTKVSLAGLFIIISLIAFSSIYKRDFRNLLYSLILIVFCVIVTINSPVYYFVGENLTQQAPSSSQIVLNNEEDNNEEDNNETTVIANYKNNIVNRDFSSGQEPEPEYVNFVRNLLSDREIYYHNIKTIYIEKDFTTQFLGIGFSDNHVEDEYIVKMIEMDFFDIYFRLGILGFIIFFLPLAYLSIDLLMKVIKKKIINIDIITCVLAIGMILGIAFISGHVLGAPSVSLLLSLTIIYLINLVEESDKKTNNK